MEMEFVKETCKIGQGAACCRYLLGGSVGFECGKLNEFRTEINKRAPTMSAQGDNCDGVWFSTEMKGKRNEHG